MSTAHKWVLLLALIGLAACAPAAPIPTATQAPQATPAPSTSATPIETVLIRYHRSGGIAGADATWVIYTSGRVEYAGRGQGHALQVGASQLAALTSLLAAIEAVLK